MRFDKSLRTRVSLVEPPARREVSENNTTEPLLMESRTCVITHNKIFSYLIGVGEYIGELPSFEIESPFQFQHAHCITGAFC